MRVDRRPEAWVLRLSRPERHNAFDARMREELCDAAAAADAAPAAVVLVGDGPSFCSGGDLDEFVERRCLAVAAAWHPAGAMA